MYQKNKKHFLKRFDVMSISVIIHILVKLTEIKTLTGGRQCIILEQLCYYIF